MAGLEKEIKKVTKGSAGKKSKKSGRIKKSGSRVEKAAKNFLKLTPVPMRTLPELREAPAILLLTKYLNGGRS